ncbi:MAG: diguanylate cyclase domain-containing protein [Burkholderiales bacterium]
MNAPIHNPPPSDALWASLAETANDLLWSVDLEGRWTYVNPAAARRIYGCDPAEMLGRPMHDSAVAALRARDAGVLARVLAGQSVFDHETRHERRDGTGINLSFNAVPLRDRAGAVLGATGTARDITAERAASAALQETVEKLRLAVDVAELKYWEWDRETGRLQWGSDPLPGAAGGRVAQWTEYRELVHPDDRESYLAKIETAWQSGGTCVNEYRLAGRDGRMRWVSSHGMALPDGSGRLTRMIGVSQDITERKRREEEARFLAYHDTLTGLPNRRLLDDRLAQALHLAQRRDVRLAVMLVDLDEFKLVNDRYGHRTGDAVLREAARRLAACVRKADTLARQGGDEFVVVIPELAPQADGRIVADKILRALEMPLEADGAALRIGASVGISLYPDDARDGEALLRNADAAMYRAKQSGGRQHRHYGR